MKGVQALALGIALVTCASAGAEPAEDPYSRNGFYVSLGGYYQKENYDDTCQEADADGCIEGFRPDSSGGVVAKAGYRFHRYVAGELQFEWIKDALEDRFDEAGYVGTLNAKVIYPFRWFQPFALVGGGFMRFPVPRDGRNISVENGLAFRFGGGFDLYFNEHWGLLAEVSYVQPTPINDLDKVPFLSVGGGLQYRF